MAGLPDWAAFRVFQKIWLLKINERRRAKFELLPTITRWLCSQNDSLKANQGSEVGMDVNTTSKAADIC